MAEGEAVPAAIERQKEPANAETRMPPPTAENGDAAAPGWPGSDAEAAELALARERGEPSLTPAAQSEPEFENESGALPTLDSLVAKIPPVVLETLEDLFRAKFTRVVRVRKKDLTPI